MTTSGRILGFTWGIIRHPEVGTQCFMDFDHWGVLENSKPSKLLWIKMASVLLWYSITGKKS